MLITSFVSIQFCAAFVIFSLLYVKLISQQFSNWVIMFGWNLLWEIVELLQKTFGSSASQFMAFRCALRICFDFPKSNGFSNSNNELLLEQCYLLYANSFMAEVVRYMSELCIASDTLLHLYSTVHKNNFQHVILKLWIWYSCWIYCSCDFS